MLKLVRPLALFIMIAAMASSYHTQLGLFRLWQVDLFTAVIAPFAVDALAVICAIAIGTTGARGKGLAAAVLVVTLGGSMTANFIAGLTLGSKIVHAAMVLLYLLAELVSSRVGAGETTARVSPEQPRVTPEVVQQAQQVVQAEVTRLPVPVSPAPKPRVTPEVDRAPIPRREVRSPLTGRVLTERPPLK